MAASRFLATSLWIWTEQNVTVGESVTAGRRSKRRTTRALTLHVFLLVDGSVMGITAARGSNVSLLSKMGRSLPSEEVWNWSATRAGLGFTQTQIG